MLKKIIFRLVHGRHFWRDAGFDELSELYASIVLRGLAINIVGIFIPIYLYKIGYSLSTIFGFFAVFFTLRILFDFISGYLVGKFGPKHILGLSTVLQIAYLTLVLSLKDLHWPLMLICVIWSLSVSLFFIAFHTDFSKIKHKNHSGKEIGFSYILERLGGVFGPLIGGVLATIFDARYSIVVAIIILILSLIPFMFSSEPVRLNQHIDFFNLPWRGQIRNYIANSAFNLENTASILLWPLLIGVTVFSSNTYAKLGVVTSLSTALTLLVIYMIGKAIDERNSNKLLRGSIIINACLHLIRPLMLTNIGAVTVSLINDPVTVSYRMPLTKGFYNEADSLPGHRIAYIVTMEAVGSFLKALFWLAVLFLAKGTDEIFAMQWIYLPVAIYSLFMLRQNFVALRGK